MLFHCSLNQSTMKEHLWNPSSYSRCDQLGIWAESWSGLCSTGFWKLLRTDSRASLGYSLQYWYFQLMLFFLSCSQNFLWVTYISTTSWPLTVHFSKSLTLFSNLKFSSKLTYFFSSNTSIHLAICYLQAKVLFWSSGGKKVLGLWTKLSLTSSVK